jgi:putative membrane protein
MLRVIVAGFHLLALGLGFYAVLTRGNVLREPITAQSLHRAFLSDNIWGFAAALWIATGLWRLLALEKGVEYYLSNHFFLAKMTLFVLIFALEVWPMITLIRWRISERRGLPLQEFATVRIARRIATISHVEALIVVLMVFFAAAMARGYGMAS